MQRRARPYVVINMGMTADAKIATADRTITSFGSPADHRHLYELRASADAVLCGAATASEPGVTLDDGGPAYARLRRRNGRRAALVRVIVSGRARIQLQAPVFRDRSGPIVVLVTAHAPAARVRRLRGLVDAVPVFGDETLDLSAALIWLRQEFGVRRLVCEGGAAVNEAMLRAGLVDELHLTLCPKLVGGRSAPTIAEGLGVGRLAQAHRFELRRCRRVGDEVFLEYRALPPAPSTRSRTRSKPAGPSPRPRGTSRA